MVEILPIEPLHGFVVDHGEADAAAAAPTAPIESFLVVGPIGPDRELIKL